MEPDVVARVDASPHSEVDLDGAHSLQVLRSQLLDDAGCAPLLILCEIDRKILIL